MATICIENYATLSVCLNVLDSKQRVQWPHKRETVWVQAVGGGGVAACGMLWGVATLVHTATLGTHLYGHCLTAAPAVDCCECGFHAFTAVFAVYLGTHTEKGSRRDTQRRQLDRHTKAQQTVTNDNCHGERQRASERSQRLFIYFNFVASLWHTKDKAASSRRKSGRQRETGRERERGQQSST